MKCKAVPGAGQAAGSLPVRGAWVEIFVEPLEVLFAECRSPCGERGLKSLGLGIVAPNIVSLPVRGAWVEMPTAATRWSSAAVAPRAGSVG